MLGTPYTTGVIRRALDRGGRSINPGPIATELMKKRVVRAAVKKLFPQRVRRRRILKRLGGGNPAPAALLGAAGKIGGLFKAGRFKGRGARDKERRAAIDALARDVMDGDPLAEAELERLTAESATAAGRAYARQQLTAIRKARAEIEKAEAAERGRAGAAARLARETAAEERREQRRFETRKAGIGAAGTLAAALLRGRALPRRRRAPRRRSARDFDF